MVELAPVPGAFASTGGSFWCVLTGTGIRATVAGAGAAAEWTDDDGMAGRPPVTCEATLIPGSGVG